MKKILGTIIGVLSIPLICTLMLFIDVQYNQETNQTKSWLPRTATIVNTSIKYYQSRGYHHCIKVYLKTISSNGSEIFSYLETPDNCKDVYTQFLKYPINTNIAVLVNPENETQIRSSDFPNRKFSYWHSLPFAVILGLTLYALITRIAKKYSKRELR